MLRAIETIYDGHAFRSRIEARHACFFNALGIPYEYEPEGFELGNGARYLPDFYLTGLGYWFEVKGKEPTPDDIRKMLLFVEQSHQTIFIASGSIPKQEEPMTADELAEWFTLHENDDFIIPNNLDMIDYMPYGSSGTWKAWHHGGGLQWCECSGCHRVGIHWFTDPIRHDVFCQCDAPLIDDSPRILAAYDAARMARFEFGKHGN